MTPPVSESDKSVSLILCGGNKDNTCDSVSTNRYTRIVFFVPLWYLSFISLFYILNLSGKAVSCLQRSEESIGFSTHVYSNNGVKPHTDNNKQVADYRQ